MRRYEELLELPRGLLVATADTLYRYSAPAATGPPTLDRRAQLQSGVGADSRLYELLERALSADEMHGRDWDDLTDYLSRTPSIVIFPRRHWAELAGRLLDETMVADGLPWMQRFESLNRLIGHPVGGPAAVAACASLAADRSSQVFIEPVSVLDASSHPDATRHVLAQLQAPTNARARYGALLACVRKVRFGHFTPNQVRGLIPVVSEMLLDPDSHADAAALGVEVLRQLPADLHPMTNAKVRRALAGDRTLSEVLIAGRLAARAPSSTVVDRVVAAAWIQLDCAGLSDDLLPLLVDEMLYAPVFDVRLYASMLISASPYRRPVAAALAAELAKPHVAGDATLAGSMLAGLRFVGGARQRPLVERLILAPGLPAAVPAAAAQHIGHMGGRSNDLFWLNAIANHGRRWRRHREPHSALALHGLVYALGMARDQRTLAQMRDDDQAPSPVRAAAKWWLDRPARISSSARH